MKQHNNDLVTESKMTSYLDKLILTNWVSILLPVGGVIPPS